MNFKKNYSNILVQDKLLQSAFLSLNGDKNEIKQKILYINKLFDINKFENERFIVRESNDYEAKSFVSWIRRESKLHMKCSFINERLVFILLD